MNALPTSDLALEQRIWRYMDLTKFVLMLTHRALYFAPLSELNDPFEGYMPRSHAEALGKIVDETLYKRIPQLKEESKAQGRDLDRAFDRIAADARQKISLSEARRGFGVNCWHANEHESEAMWRLYSALGCGVAIESTVERLRDVLHATPGMNIKRVQYVDFDKAQIVKGQDPHILMCKRPSYEYEHEVRAMMPLKSDGVGEEVSCDLNCLIIRVHISPIAPPIFQKVIEEICSGTISGQKLPFARSRLLDAPDYDICSKP